MDTDRNPAADGSPVRSPQGSERPGSAFLFVTFALSMAAAGTLLVAAMPILSLRAGWDAGTSVAAVAAVGLGIFLGGLLAVRLCATGLTPAAVLALLQAAAVACSLLISPILLFGAEAAQGTLWPFVGGEGLGRCRCA